MFAGSIIIYISGFTFRLRTNHRSMEEYIRVNQKCLKTLTPNLIKFGLSPRWEVLPFFVAGVLSAIGRI